MAQNKLGCMLTLQAYLGSRKDTSILHGITGEIGWNILSDLIKLIALLVTLLMLPRTCKTAESFRGMR